MPLQDLSSNSLRSEFLKFFEGKGHKVMPSSSLLPENDPSVLFTTAGMQQFKRFYDRPEEAPAAAVATCQKCVRTGDIEEVGDETHDTYFEMLGNFSFGFPDNDGSYFKKEAISFAWEFLTEVLGVEKERLSCTYFAGDKGIPEDHESREMLKEVTGLEDAKILGTGFDETFWSLGTEGSPGGPTVEFYIDGIEIWNLVFNQYKMENGQYVASQFKGVDTGMGFERLAMAMQNKPDVYQTDLFWPLIQEIEKLSGLQYGDKADKDYEKCWVDTRRSFRIIADHIKASVFIASEGVEPSNKGQGYILRRLIRRAVRYGWLLNIKATLAPVMEAVIKTYSHENINRDTVLSIIQNEEERFLRSIDEGLKKAKNIFGSKRSIPESVYAKIMQLENKGDVLGLIYEGKSEDDKLSELGIAITNQEIIDAYIPGREAFNLFQTFGFPIEMIVELAQAEHLFVDIRGFREELKSHQDKSRTASAGMFKGGLAGDQDATRNLHTATHMLLAALRQVLGDHVYQKGSNITSERLRFDFSHPDKMTEQQIKKVEDIVNEKIKEALPVKMEEMPVFEAKESGAMGVFDEKYAQNVKVYTIGPSTLDSSTSSEPPFSREICGGPHATNTSELGHFKIQKEESSSSGVRRIKAVLE